MFEQIAEFISKHTDIPVEDITPDSDIVRDLGLSSFDVVELITHCETEFGVSIPDRKIKYMATVGDVVEYMQSQME